MRVLQKGQFQADPKHTASLSLTFPLYTAYEYNNRMFSQALERLPTLTSARHVAHTLLNTAEAIV